MALLWFVLFSHRVVATTRTSSFRCFPPPQGAPTCPQGLFIQQRGRCGLARVSRNGTRQAWPPSPSDSVMSPETRARSRLAHLSYHHPAPRQSQPTDTPSSHRHRHYYIARRSHVLPSANPVKMKFTVAAPLVALFTAYILALLALLAGIKPNFMPDAYIGQYKPSHLPCPHLLWLLGVPNSTGSLMPASPDCLEG